MKPCEQAVEGDEAEAEFPRIPLRLYVEALGAVIGPVLDGRCAFGIVALPIAPPQLHLDRLLGVRMIMAASPQHPLASFDAPIPAAILAQHVQLVLTDRSDLSQGKEFAVFSPKTWRLSDLGAKHAFLLAGLNWGGMPFGVIERDITSGRLLEIKLEDVPTDKYILGMSAAYRTDKPPGRAGRWLIDRLKEDDGRRRFQPVPSGAATGPKSASKAGHLARRHKKRVGRDKRGS